MIRKKLKRTVTVLIISSVSVLYLFYFYFSPVKELKEFLNRPYSIEFFDRDENLLQVSGLKNGLRREYSDFEEIPPALRNAFFKTEDRNFLKHHGVDFSALLRAAFQNLRGKRTVSGASTITMQLAKLIYNSENRGLNIKIKEIFLALQLEKRFSKKQILTLYLNNLPFGNNVDGVTSASRYYFSKDLKNLNKEEIMLLSIIPRRPELYNPLKNPGFCAKKASEIFNYPEEKLITTAENLPPHYNWPFECPHLIEEAKKHLKKETKKVRLTLSRELQAFSEFTLSETLKDSAKSRINNGAVVVIDNKTSEILCWIGNYSWFDKEHSGEINGVLVKNQMGSSMKPFLYAAALEKKDPLNTEKNLFKPNQVLSDIPMEFGNDSLYFPRNFNNRYNGPVLFRACLASSLNIPAVYLLHEITVPYYLDILYDLGFSSLKEDGIKNDLALSLGSGEVTLLELTGAFTVFAKDGIFTKPFYISGQSGESRKVFEKDTARIICDMLSDKKSRVTGFGYTQTFQTNYPSIFKTGTANQFQNIVALGGTPDYTVGVWMGNFSGNTVVGKTGSSLPAKVAKEILDYLTGTENKGFLKPENYTKVPVCSLSGLMPGPDCPRTVDEYVKNTELTHNNEKCLWHQKDGDGKLKTFYPAEYESVISQNFVNAEINHSTSPLKITSPLNGSIFYYDETNPENQKIPLKIIGGIGQDQKLSIYYDDTEMNEETFYTSQILLPVEKGIHRVRAVCGEESQEIYFEVK